MELWEEFDLHKSLFKEQWNFTAPAQKHRAEAVPYTTKVRAFKNQGSHHSIMHLIIWFIFSIMEDESNLT